MAKETSRRLAQYLQANTDGRLRSVVHYTPDDYELVYLRDDVEELYSGEELESVADQLRIENLEPGPNGGVVRPWRAQLFDSLFSERR